MIWRADGAKSRTLSESIPVGAAFSTLLTLYTGFVIPVPYMHPWLRWFAYVNPGFFAFESLMVNEVRSISSSWSCVDEVVSDSSRGVDLSVQASFLKALITIIRILYHGGARPRVLSQTPPS